MADEQTTSTTETIPGGRYLAADGETFVDANGEPINEPKPEPKAKAKAPAKDAE